MPRKPIPPVVAGLDLSLTGTGVAVIRSAVWGLDVKRIFSRRFGEKLKGSNESANYEARVRRLATISNEVVGYLAGHGVTHCFVENYSFSMQHAAHQLGELGGVMKVRIYESLGIVATPVSNSTARKLFLGRGAGKGIKEEVARQLASLGWDRSGDEGDAAICANYGLSELGLPAISVSLPVASAAR